MSWKERTEISKNIIDVTKGIFIIVIVAVLLFKYDWVNDLFDKYNVAQLEFGGLKVDRSDAVRRLKESADKLPQLQGQIDEAKIQFDALKSQYSEATRALEAMQNERNTAVSQLRTLQAGTNAPPPAAPPNALSNQVERILSEEKPTLDRAAAAQTALTSASVATRAALASLPAADTSGAQNALIFGGYPTLRSAQAAVADAQAKGFGGAVVYIREGSYRTALQFASEFEASSKLLEARTLSSRTYLVDLRKWCPKPTVESGNVLNCRL
jgi:TolA-binding protein